jgi:hypothetical protein
MAWAQRSTPSPAWRRAPRVPNDSTIAILRWKTHLPLRLRTAILARIRRLIFSFHAPCLGDNFRFLRMPYQGLVRVGCRIFSESFDAIEQDRCANSDEAIDTYIANICRVTV